MLSRLSFTAARSFTRSVAPVASTSTTSTRNYASGVTPQQKKPIRVAVTGAAGQIGYALIFRIASGEMFGKDQPVQLQLLELEPALDKLKGTVMELEDCAFPLLRKVVQTSDEKAAFEGADVAVLVGAKPRSKGMERKDLLTENGKIFTSQGKALNATANRDTLKVLVVGNPANTNCLIAARNAPNIDPKRFTAMTRLDHNRALHQLATKTGVTVNDVKNMAIWGNHSATMHPDLTNTTINGKAANSLVDHAWVKDQFIPIIQQRGAAILAARGVSSAASAAGSAIDHIRDWHLGTNGEWTSMAVLSDGSYGEDKGLYFSYPVTCENGVYKIVQGLKMDAFCKERFQKTLNELKEERAAVEHML